MSTGLLNPAKTSPPSIHDASQYTRVERVPVFSSHIRKIVNPETGEARITKVDGKQLEVICANTNNRVDRKEFPLVFIGHTDPRLREVDQPPVAGYLGRHEIGEYNGEPVIMAEMFIKNEYLDSLDQFPRRSAEVFRKEQPSGYIDSVALLKRAPELDLGYVTRHSKEEGFERFECQCHKEDKNMSENEGSEIGNELATDQETNETEQDGASEMDGETSGNVEKLAKVLAKHAVDMMKSDPEFHKVLGENISQNLANNPEFLDAFMSRMGEILESSLESEELGNSDRDTEVENHDAGSAGTASGTNTFTPEDNDMPENFNKDTDPNVQIGLLSARLDAVIEDNKKKDERILELENFNKSRDEELRVIRRRDRLKGIADSGVKIDVEKSMERFSKLNDDDFELFAKDAEENYPRVPGGEYIPVASDNGVPTPRKDAQPAPNELTAKEVEDKVIERFAKDNNLSIVSPTDAIDVVDRYFRTADRSKYGVKK